MMNKEFKQSKDDRNFKTAVVICLIAVVVCLSIAYAALAKKLTIKGTADVKKASWKVEMKDPTSQTSGDDVKITYDSKITKGVTSIEDLHVILRKPGDWATLNVTLNNNGDIPAHLTSITGNGIITCTGTSGPTKEADEKIICGIDGDNTNASVKYTVTYNNTDVTKGDSTVSLADRELTIGATKNVMVKVEYLSTATRIPTNEVHVKLPDIAFLFDQDV